MYRTAYMIKRCLCLHENDKMYKDHISDGTCVETSVISGLESISVTKYYYSIPSKTFTDIVRFSSGIHLNSSFSS